VKLGLIYARSANGVIGHEGKIPWSLPEDMVRFKQITTNTTVIMGRKTWESLPSKFRPLPDRKNIVLSRQQLNVPEGVEVLNSLEMAIDLCRHIPQVWIIGGSSVYQEALDFADTIEETIVGVTCDGDAFSPKLGIDRWDVTKQISGTSKTGLEYLFFTHTKRSLIV